MAHPYHQASGEITSPTLRPTPGFHADEDCQKLRTAMKGLGTDEKAIIDVLGHRTSNERLQIVTQYKTMFGKDLIKELNSELSGKFSKVALALCQPPDVYDTMQLREAMKGAGTDEDTLIEILCSRNNKQIQTITEKYKQLYPGRNLEADIESETSGHFKRILVSLAQGNRDESHTVDQAAARRDANVLYEAGEKNLGTDESQFNAILGSKSIAYLRAVFREYANISRSIEDAIKSEMSGNLRDSYLAIVECIQNKPAFFAHQLHESMAGAGTNDQKLIRIVISRCEIDMGQIKQEFEKLYGKSLASWIKDDTSGDYERILLALIGES